MLVKVNKENHKKEKLLSKIWNGIHTLVFYISNIFQEMKIIFSFFLIKNRKIFFL